MREGGATKNGIAATLTTDGVPTRTRAPTWSAMVISRILRGREPLGEIHHGGEYRRADTPPSWTPRAGPQCRRSMSSRAVRPRRPVGRMSERHLFQRGALRCSCGAAMPPAPPATRPTPTLPHPQARRHPLPGAARRRDLVDRAALQMFEEVVLDVEATRAHVVAQLDARRG